MLEDYLAFAKGDGGEEAAPTNVGELLGEVQEETEHLGTPIEVRMRQPKQQLVLPLKRQAFKRAVTNLVTNAGRFGDYVIIRAAADDAWLRIEVDDDGPGIPPAERDNVFRPFYRLDHARNQDDGQLRPGARHRPRHRPQPRRRRRARHQLDGRPARDHPRAALARRSLSCAAPPAPQRSSKRPGVAASASQLRDLKHDLSQRRALLRRPLV